ncbi:MAG: EamA/RhaT family transporter, partial [Alphaproteobacteria bacterium]
MDLRGVLYALAAFAIFATHDAIIKTLGQGYSPIQLIFFSTLFGFPLVTLMLMHDPTRGNLRPVHPVWVGIRTAATVGASLCVFYAFSVLPLAQTYAILFTMPLIITVLAVPMLGERIG